MYFPYLHHSLTLTACQAKHRHLYIYEVTNSGTISTHFHVMIDIISLTAIMSVEKCYVGMGNM